MAKSSSSPSAIQSCHLTEERTPIQTTREDQMIFPAFSDKRIVRLCYWAWLNIKRKMPFGSALTLHLPKLENHSLSSRGCSYLLFSQLCKPCRKWAGR